MNKLDPDIKLGGSTWCEKCESYHPVLPFCPILRVRKALERRIKMSHHGEHVFDIPTSTNLESMEDEKMKDRYITYDPVNCETNFHTSLEEAEASIRDGNHWGDGFPDELVDGGYVIAKVTHVSAVKITDKKENYMCVRDDDVPANCSNCDNSQGCDGEEWPYGNDIDWVGDVCLKEVANK